MEGTLLAWLPPPDAAHSHGAGKWHVFMLISEGLMQNLESSWRFIVVESRFLSHITGPLANELIEVGPCRCHLVSGHFYGPFFVAEDL